MGRYVPVSEVCYLCGKLLKDPTNKDHIPPRLFFARSVRQRYNLNKLLTAKVHQECNASYRMDEEYLVFTLMPYIRKSEAGLALYKQILAEYKQGKNVALIKQVFAEFEPRLSGFVLPGGRLLERRDGERIRRVAYKIGRGLHFHRFCAVKSFVASRARSRLPLPKMGAKWLF